MSESMVKSRQATSGWRRISVAAISALFAFILARFSLRNRPALPERTAQAEPDDDALDSQIRLRLTITMASAPPDFTNRVIARIASTPLQQPSPVPAAPVSRVSWLRSARIIAFMLLVAMLLMLATGLILTMVNPPLALSILDAFISLAIALLALGRMIGQLISRASATPWIIPAVLGGLLGCLLLSWAQLARQFGRDPQEA